MVDACMKVWGGADLTATPRLAKCLTAVFHALAQHRLSLAEARFLTNTQLEHEARALTNTIHNEEFWALWQEFLYTYDERTRAEFFESTTSRLMKFVGNPIIRDIMGQTDNLINFRECMDNGEVVLVNLSRAGQISKETARLLGALITNDLYTTAFTRDVEAAKDQPFYLYIDECAQFLTEDIVNSLDETRKFGLHLTLSHQRIGQLQEYGENFYNAVMAGAQAKVVFKVGDDDTADLLSRHLFRTTFDLERPKSAMDKPFTVGHEVRWFESVSRTVSTVEGTGEGEGGGEVAGAALSQLFNTQDVEVGGYTAIESSSESSAYSTNRFEASSESYTEGASEGLEPLIEWLPTELYKLDELIHLGMVELRSLPPRTAYVATPVQAPIKISTLDIRPGRLLEEFVPIGVELLNDQSTAVSKRTDIRAKIKRRAEEIERRTREPVYAEDDDGRGY